MVDKSWICTMHLNLRALHLCILVVVEQVTHMKNMKTEVLQLY